MIRNALEEFVVKRGEKRWALRTRRVSQAGCQFPLDLVVPAERIGRARRFRSHGE